MQSCVPNPTLVRSRQLSHAVSPTLLRFNQPPYAVIKSNARLSSPVNHKPILKISSILLRFHQLSCTFRRSHQLSCALVTIVCSHQFSNTLVCASSLKLSSTIKSSHQPCALFSSQALRLLLTLVRSHQLPNKSRHLLSSTLMRSQPSYVLINSRVLSSTLKRSRNSRTRILSSTILCSHQFSCALITSCAFSSTLVRSSSNVV